ncbi:MAG TPA: PhoH family protein [Candidatus Omnitrophota bacterium]|nr:PhoH family protein [Candidatus Omnitrophota bacterium]HOX09280.1 PhoH family protein [Candidatus Omnitrophota bacterium]HRZ66849.1 PhoH family protein [Candidatus Omnitrophota bacterium]
MDKNFKLLSDEEARILFGRHDENLKAIEREFDVKVTARGENLTIGGDARNVEKASRLFEQLLDIIRMGRAVRQHEILYAIKALHGSPDIDLHSIYLDKIDIMSKKLFVTPKTAGQKAYVDAIRQFDIVFGIGPAGTGKTYLAMAMAINALKLGHVSRIVLTRPAVEAGESLGFLPGDLEEKVSPYLRPLYDALYEMMDLDKVERFLSRGVIEVAPLAFMRGRTLNDSFIILDEAQNATAEQMKMFLTRLGFDSKTVITGDLTQSDLPGGRAVGLIQSQEVLKGIEGIKFTYFTGDDVVRHELVQEIIRAYEKYGGK